MSDWPIMRLRDAKVTLTDCDHRTPPEAVSGYPYVAIPQLKSGRLDMAKVRRISREHYVEWTRKAKPLAGDVVLSRRCNPGETAVVPVNLEFAVGQNLVLLRADGTKIHPSFLRWLLRGPEWWRQVNGFINVGAVFDSLKCADIPNFQLTIPPLPEQRAIAHILGTLDDKIELNRLMNETVEEMVRALFRSWFVNFDPVRAKTERRNSGLPRHIADLFPDSFEQSGLGEIPKGWEVANLRNACSAIFSGGTPNTREPGFWGGGIPWLSSGETRETFIISTEKTITQAGVLGSSTRFAPKGSTVVASAGQGRTRGQTSLLMIDAYVNQSVVVLRADRAVASDLFLFCDLGERYEEFRRMSDSSSSRGSLTTKILGEIPVVLPPKPLVDLFDQKVSPLVLRVGVASGESRVLARLRDALLPELLSGELRIPDVERLLEVAL